MDEKDSMTPDTIPQSTPVDGTVSAGRKNRRPVVIGVAAVAAVALVDLHPRTFGIFDLVVAAGP